MGNKLLTNRGILSLTKDDINYNNLLLSEFFGYDHISNLGAYCDLDGEWKGIFFHMSWDWIMPVCKKWDRLYDNVDVELYDYETYVELCERLDNTVVCYDFNDVYDQLVYNIKWYNNQEKIN